MGAGDKRSGSWTGVVSVVAIVISISSAIIAYLSYDAAKDTALRGLRAYLIVSAARIDAVKPGVMVFGFKVQNIGQTPAYRLRQFLYVDFLPKPPARNTQLNWTPGGSTAYMGKELQVGGIESRGFSKTEIEAIKSGGFAGRQRLYVVGRIFYEDIYRISRCVDFCFMYLGGATGTNFSYCPTFNDADYGTCQEPESK